MRAAGMRCRPGAGLAALHARSARIRSAAHTCAGFQGAQGWQAHMKTLGLGAIADGADGQWLLTLRRMRGLSCAVRGEPSVRALR